MFGKIGLFWDLFQKGKAVADPALWKGRQITSTMLAGAILAVIHLAKGFGYDIPIDTDTADTIAAGFIAIVNTILTLTTSKTVGFTSAESVSGEPVQDSVQSNQQGSEQEASVQDNVSGAVSTTITAEDLARARAYVAAKQSQR